MNTSVFSSGELREYHEALLIVKVRPSVGPRAAMAAAPVGWPSPLATPGISALATLERAGMVRRVVPLSRSAEELPGPRRMAGAVAALAGTAPAPDTEGFNAGVSLVELQRDAEIQPLQIALASDPNVEFASRVPIRYLLARPAAVPPAPSTMWNLRKIRWEEARALQGYREAAKVKVAVLDTGIQPDHPDLAGRVSRYTYAHPDIPTASGDKDIIGHGTHVAGTIAASINNLTGVNGICQCQLFAWKIFDDTSDYDPGSNTFVYFVEPAMYLRALAECLDAGVGVINLSIGGPGRPDPQEQQLFDLLLANNTAIVAAMGNERSLGSPTSYPAAIPGVIAVGATNVNDRVANFSNRGNHISLCAPGVAIWSTLPTYPGQIGFIAVPGPGGRPIEGKPQRRETDYDAWDGTSMATPHVAAAAALLIANKGQMTSTDVRKQLMGTTDKIPWMNNANFHPDYGAGRLNLVSLLQ